MITLSTKSAAIGSTVAADRPIAGAGAERHLHNGQDKSDERIFLKEKTFNHGLHLTAVYALASKPAC